MGKEKCDHDWKVDSFTNLVPGGEIGYVCAKCPLERTAPAGVPPQEAETILFQEGNKLFAVPNDRRSLSDFMRWRAQERETPAERFDA